MSQGEGGGRPTHEPTDYTRSLVKDLISLGVRRERIAEKLQIHVDTLAKHYKYELDTGKTDVIQKIGGRLVAKALDDDDLGAQIFYLKTQAGWTEKPRDENTATALSLVEQALALRKKSEE